MASTARVLAAVAAASVATLLSVSPAAAACSPGSTAYPPSSCATPAISDSTVVPGQSVTATSGDGQFTPGNRVNVELHSTAVPLGSVTASSAGAATITFTVPSTLSLGAHQVVFSGSLAGVPHTVSVPFTVVSAAAAAPAKQLSFTGFEVGAVSLLGLGLVGAGSASLLVGRRRKATFA
jgi:hypothetical protein